MNIIVDTNVPVVANRAAPQASANIIVDTNVPVVANRAAPQASAQCVVNCVRKLQQIQQEHTLVLDDDWHILREYIDNLRSDGQPGVGDAFLKWVLTNRNDPQRCTLVSITPQANGFVEFPSDPQLNGFDPSDQKFVAVAIAHPEHPPVLNATDSDWRRYRQALSRRGVCTEFVCPDVQLRSLAA